VKQGVLGRFHIAYFTITLTYNPVNPVLLMLYLDNISLKSDSRM